MNEQNAIFAQPAGGVEQQPTALPQAGLGAQGQTDTQSILLGGGFDTATLLNQSQVLGTSSTQEADATPIAAKTTGNRGHVPILVISVALVVMVIVALLFKMIDSNRENS